MSLWIEGNPLLNNDNWAEACGTVPDNHAMHIRSLWTHAPLKRKFMWSTWPGYKSSWPVWPKLERPIK